MSLTQNRRNTNITDIRIDTNKSNHRVHLIKDDNEFADSLYSEKVKTLPKPAIKCT
jgi:hypothetical protein